MASRTPAKISCRLCNKSFGHIGALNTHIQYCPGSTREDLLKFLEKVGSKNLGDASRCWTPKSGHGRKHRFRILGKYAHIVVFEVWFGPVSEGFIICHDCDIPACANPYHLFEGTPRQNNEDKWRKGRGSEKLTTLFGQ